MKLSNLLEGLLILKKYYDFDDYFSAEHDQIWLCGGEDIKIFREDEGKLNELGFFKDEDSWSCFP